jgi:hypothetical protein
MNTINIIHPYRHNGTWVFDDARHGLVREPFISGADVLIDRAVTDIPNAAEGFNLIFSAGPFPDHQYRLERRRTEFDGNWYYLADFDAEGWLCPALLHYFAEAPDEIFVKVEPAQPTDAVQAEHLQDELGVVLKDEIDNVFTQLLAEPHDFRTEVLDFAAARRLQRQSRSDDDHER